MNLGIKHFCFQRQEKDDKHIGVKTDATVPPLFQEDVKIIKYKSFHICVTNQCLIYLKQVYDIYSENNWFIPNQLIPNQLH